MKLRLNLFIAFTLILFFMGGIGCDGSTAGASLNAIVITPFNSTLFKGATKQFTATGIYSDGSSVDLSSEVTWSSSDTAVGTIAETGILTSVGAGATTIIATLNSVTSNTTTLSVILNLAGGYSKANVADTGYLPLAYSSNDVGNTWALLPAFTLPAGQALGVLNEIVCAENKCVAVGLTFQDPPAHYLSVAYTSSDGGSTWNLVDDFELPSGQTQGEMDSVTCVSNVCTAVGQSYDNTTFNELPFAYTSNDSGNTWTLATALTLPVGQTNGLIGDVSCQGTSCTTVGFSHDNSYNNYLPMAYTSSDSGNTWALSSSLDLPVGQTQGQTVGIACVSNVCTAVGQSFNTLTSSVPTDGLPLVYTSSDSGSTWTLLSAFELPQTSGQLSDIFCKGSYCVAVGQSFDTLNTDSLPLAYTSNDGGSTWELVSAFTLPAGQVQGLLNTVSCADNVCIALGATFIADNDNTLPLSYTSSDHGNTWTLSPAFALPTGQTQGLFE